MENDFGTEGGRSIKEEGCFLSPEEAGMKTQFQNIPVARTLQVKAMLEKKIDFNGSISKSFKNEFMHLSENFHLYFKKLLSGGKMEYSRNRVATG